MASLHPSCRLSSVSLLENQNVASAPLTGLTVIELGRGVAAPYDGEILGNLGANVIKVEKLEGDDARSWAPPYWAGMSATFQSFNRNKRSVVDESEKSGGADAVAEAHFRSSGMVIAPEPAAWFGCAIRLGCRVAAGIKAVPDLLHVGGIWQGRAAQGSSRLRPLDAGIRGDHECYGRAAAAGAGGNLNHRYGHRNVVGHRRPCRALATARERQRRIN